MFADHEDTPFPIVKLVLESRNDSLGVSMKGSQVYFGAQDALRCLRPPSYCLLRACVSLSSRLSKLPFAKSFLLLFAVSQFLKDPHVSASSWQLAYVEMSHLLSCANEEIDLYATVTRYLLHRRKVQSAWGYCSRKERKLSA
jgi:hypothetical protein